VDTDGETRRDLGTGMRDRGEFRIADFGCGIIQAGVVSGQTYGTGDVMSTHYCPNVSGTGQSSRPRA
jgi:hypothetical protein